MFFDETKINHLGSDGRKWVWKKVGEGLTDRQVVTTHTRTSVGSPSTSQIPFDSDYPRVPDGTPHLHSALSLSPYFV